MFRAHIAIVIYALFVLFFAALTLFITKRFASESPGDPAGLLPEEAAPAEGEGRDLRSTRPYLLVLLIVFVGVESTFLILWARLYRTWFDGHLAFAFSSMFVFAGIVFLGHIWIYKKGALPWE